MCGVRMPLNLQEVDRSIGSLVRRLGLPALLETPELGRSAALHARANVVEPLREQLASELERRLVERRDHNSEAAELAVDERKGREERLFAAALLELLPRVRQLHKAEALIAWLSSTPYDRPAAAVEDGLLALAEREWQRALDLLAGAGEPLAVLLAAQEQRARLAAQRLDNAYSTADRMYIVVDMSQRRRVCIEIDAHLVSPALLLGTEAQRVRARWLRLELEAAAGAPLPA